MVSTILASPENVTKLGIGLDHPESISVGADGTIYAGGEKGQVYRILPGGAPQQYASTSGDLLGSALDADGNLYVCDCANAVVHRVSPDGTVAQHSAGTPDRPMAFPNHPAFDSAGNLYVSDSGDYWHGTGTGAIYVIRPDGTTEVFHHGPLRYPNGIAVDPDQQWLYIAQSPAWDIVRVPLDRPDGPVEQVFRLPDYTVPDGMVFTDRGALLVGCYRPDRVMICCPDGRVEVLADDPTAELLLRPTNIALHDGRLLIANLGGRWISSLDVDLGREVRFRPRLPGRQPPAAALPAVYGRGARTRLHDGREVPVVRLNNAATTPPFVSTVDTVSDFLSSYGALHRGAGPHARRTCELAEDAVDVIRRFIGAGPDTGLLFTTNTSAAVNLLARLLRLDERRVVITSEVEHTSNYLPWRYNTAATVRELRADDTGALDHTDVETLVAGVEPGRLGLLAVTGASNLTGYVPELPKLAEVAHAAGAPLFVDAAQLAPHRRIDMAAWGIDALALSAHKLYAPFGLGVLALPKTLLHSVPVDPGGGSVDMITDRDLVWAPALERHQAGTWNVTGIVACAASCRAIENAGWPAILAHERVVVDHMATGLAGVGGVRLFVPPERYRTEQRIGTFPFAVDGMHHAEVAAALEHEYGIEVRAGTICNHRLVRRWFGVSEEQQCAIDRSIESGDRLASYGIVRASVGVHNTIEDIDALVTALGELASGGPRLPYRPVPRHETFEPVTN